MLVFIQGLLNFWEWNMIQQSSKLMNRCWFIASDTAVQQIAGVLSTETNMYCFSHGSRDREMKLGSGERAGNFFFILMFFPYMQQRILLKYRLSADICCTVFDVLTLQL